MTDPFKLLERVSLRNWLNTSYSEPEPWISLLWHDIEQTCRSQVAGTNAGTLATALVYREYGGNAVRGMPNTESKITALWEKQPPAPNEYDRWNFFVRLLWMMEIAEADPISSARIRDAASFVDKHWKKPESVGKINPLT